jgi:hypothetical protein
MYKKIFLKLALLLSTASSYATKGSRVLLQATRACIAKKVHLITPLLKAVRSRSAKDLEELLAQGHPLFIHGSPIVDPDTGYSLAYRAITQYDIETLNVLYEYGAKLLPAEYKKCTGWKKPYPQLFIEEAPICASADFGGYTFN